MKLIFENWRKYLNELESKLGKKNIAVDISVNSKIADDVLDDIADMVKVSYKSIGGFPSLESAEGIRSRMTNAYLIDVDEDPEPDAVVLYYDAGDYKKASAVASDGTGQGKSAVRGLMKDLLTKPGYWVEASGAAANIAIKKLNLPFVSDPKLAAYLANFGGTRETNVEWLGANIKDNMGADGWYSRDHWNGRIVKIIIGNVTIDMFPELKSDTQEKK